jgi:APA family basic amino acid/polyamine antiporter
MAVNPPSSENSGKMKNNLFNRLLKRKSPDDLIKKSQENPLKKTLGAFDLVVLGVGGIVGAGIFAIAGTAAAGGAGHVGAGPALIVSLILAAIACSFAALCYAEFASMIPVAGSAFTYTYATLGEFAAWFIGWMLVLEYLIGNVAIVCSWSGYVMNFIKGLTFLPEFIREPPIWLVRNYSAATEEYGRMGANRLTEFFETKYMNLDLNPEYIKETFANFDVSGFNPEVLSRMGFQYTDMLLDPASQIPHFLGIPIAIDLPAILIMAVITYMLYIGIQESARMNLAMVIVKTVVILLFIGVGAFYVSPENWTPFAPNGLKGIFVGAYLMFFAYIGFDAVSTAAEETKNPEKNVPIGIIGSLIVCAILYMGVIAVLTGMVPLSQIDTQAPIAAAMTSVNQNWIAFLISVGAIAGLTSVLLVLQLGGSRIVYAMARDGLIPKVFEKIHPKFKTPHINTVLIGVIVALSTFVLDINASAELCSIGTFASFIIVCAGIRILRKIDSDRERPFRVPFVPAVPILGILVCLGLIALGLPSIKILVLFGIWVAIGVAIYFAYGYHHSELQKSE